MRLAGFPAVILAAGPLAAGLWAWREADRAATARREAETAEAGRARTARTAERIRSLRERPKRASESIGKAADLSARLEASARAAGMESSCLAAIHPAERPVRLGDGEYAENTTRVMLEGVTAAQLAGFLSRLKGDSAEFNIKELRLRADPFRHDRWSAEVHLAVLIYDPAGAAPRGAAPPLPLTSAGGRP